MSNFVCPWKTTLAKKIGKKNCGPNINQKLLVTLLQDDGPIQKEKKTFFPSNDPADTHTKSLTCLLSKNTFGGGTTISSMYWCKKSPKEFDKIFSSKGYWTRYIFPQKHKSQQKPFWRYHLVCTAHSAHIWPVYHQSSMRSYHYCQISLDFLFTSVHTRDCCGGSLKKVA